MSSTVAVKRTTESVTGPAVPLWRLSPIETRVALLAFAIALVARWQALLPGYAIDDYGFVHEGIATDAAPAAAGGRVLSFVVRFALAHLGASAPRAGVIGILALTCALIAAGIIACRLWGIRDRVGESLLAVSLFSLYPYQAELFTFRTAALIFAIPLALSFSAVLVCAESWGRWTLALVAMVCALSIHQGFLNHVAMALLFSVAFHLARQDRGGRFWRSLGVRFLLIAVSLAAYGIVAGMVSRMTGHSFSSRTALIGFADIPARFVGALTLIRRIFLDSEPIFPRAPKLILIAAAAGAGALYLFAALRPATQRSLRRTGAAVLIGCAGGIPLCVGMVLLTREWWPMPRVLAQTGLFWAGILALLYSLSGAHARRLLVGCTAVIVLSFAGINNQVFADQLRVNARDFAKANRIIARVEALPEFPRLRGVVIQGGSWAYPSPIRTAQGDMNISALFAPWARTGLLNEVSGYAFQPPTAEAIAAAEARCRISPKWPTAGSVSVIGDFAVACLPPE